jgi:hypothetical protein
MSYYKCLPVTREPKVAELTTVVHSDAHTRGNRGYSRITTSTAMQWPSTGWYPCESFSLSIGGRGRPEQSIAFWNGFASAWDSQLPICGGNTGMHVSSYVSSYCYLCAHPHILLYVLLCACVCLHTAMYVILLYYIWLIYIYIDIWNIYHDIYIYIYRQYLAQYLVNSGFLGYTIHEPPRCEFEEKRYNL